MARKKKTVDPVKESVELTEQEERVGFVSTLLSSRGLPVAAIIRVCREKYGIGKTAAENLVTRAREGFRADAERARPTSKGEQIARIQSLLQKLHDTRYKMGRDKETGQEKQVEVPITPWLASRIIQAEQLLADLQGTRDPIRIAAEHRESVVLLMSNMSDERYQYLLERAQERERLARTIDVKVLSEVTA